MQFLLDQCYLITSHRHPIFQMVKRKLREVTLLKVTELGDNEARKPTMSQSLATLSKRAWNIFFKTVFVRVY